MNICEVTIKKATFEIGTTAIVRLNVSSDTFGGTLKFSMASSTDRALLQRLFECVDVTELSALCSKTLRAILGQEGEELKIKAFGHISEDKFFTIKSPADPMCKDELLSYLRAFAV